MGGRSSVRREDNNVIDNAELTQQKFEGWGRRICQNSVPSSLETL